ncbi:MAG TPA: FCD domain-containing protein [Solirubrobacteraceae bacterium]|nr:FCD domain-containing protein [Solirubrobacteraceae bacterium]
MEGATALGAVFDKVQPPTTFEETVERLGTAIRLGLLPPGTRLPPERELAEQLGISRSTLRQALTTLVQSGHLISLRGRSGGTFVSEQPPISSGRKKLRADWHDVLDERVAIECGAALLAAERGNERAFALLDELIEQMDDPPDFDAYRRADVRFHIALAEASGTPRLVAMMTEVQGQMSELISLIAHPQTVLEHANVEHRRIVKCLRGGDGVGAIRILREHLAGTEHIIAGLIPQDAARG